MPTKAELLERVRDLEVENAAMRELIDTLPALINRVSALTERLDADLGQPTGGALANKKKSDLAKATMLEMYRAGRSEHGYTKKEARQFANDVEMLLGKKLNGYSKRWLIKHLKD